MKEMFGLSAAQQDVLREILNAEGKGVERVAVFGSRATGRQRPNSDLDLVLYGDIDEAVCARLWTLFQESSLPFSVDVKSYAAINHPPLRTHIDAVSRPLFVRSGTGFTTVDE